MGTNVTTDMYCDYYLYDLDHLNIIMIAVPVLWHVLWSFGTDTISDGFTATM